MAGIEDEPATTSLVIRAACPIRFGTGVVGAVRIDLDCFGSHSFVDGVNRDFDLVCSVFRGTTRISTTVAEEGCRVLGSKLDSPKIVREVLEKGGTFTGRNHVMGRDYDTIYWPLKDVEGRMVGLVGIGRDRSVIVSLARCIVGWLFAGTSLGWVSWMVFRRTWRLHSLILLLTFLILFLITVAAGMWLYRNLYDEILAGFDRKLLALNTAVGSCLDADELVRVLENRDENSEMFLRFARPLREIQRIQGVTYLYTFLLGGSKDITYLVDVSPGEAYCPIGLEESVPPRNLEGLRRVVRQNVPYVGEIQEYERWGLLKVSAAPITGADGRVRALSGADIDVTVIQRKTQVAVFQMLGIGALAFILAGYISWWIARCLTEPIARLKEGALRVAAGQYTHLISVNHPLELHALATIFNRISATIDHLLEVAVRDHRRTVARHRSHDLARRLAADSEQGKTTRATWRWVGERADCASASGGVVCRNRFLFWEAEGMAQDQVLDAVIARRRIGVCARILLDEMDPARVTDELVRISPIPLVGAIAGDFESGVVHICSKNAIPTLWVSASGDATLRTLSNGASVPLRERESLVIVFPQEALAAVPSGEVFLAIEAATADVMAERVAHSLTAYAEQTRVGGILVAVVRGGGAS